MAVTDTHSIRRKLQATSISSKTKLPANAPASTSGSNVSFKSTTRQALELQKIEEVHKLELEMLEKREELQKRYINSKFAVLEPVSDAESSSSENKSVRSMRAYTRAAEWVRDVSHDNGRERLQHRKPITCTDMNIPVEDAGILVPNTCAQPSFLGANTTEEFNRAAFMGMNDTAVTLGRTRLSKRQIEARAVMPKSYPEFDGSPEKWPTFISAVINQTNVCGYDDYENLAMLQRALRGRAYEAVSGMLTLPGNVSNILSDLHMLFGKPHILIESLIQKVKSVPRVNTDNLNTLINFATSVKNLCATLKASNLSQYKNNPNLLNDLVNKLPGELKLNWARVVLTKKSVDINAFSKWLYKEAEAASLVSTVNVFDNVSASKRPKFAGLVQKDRSVDQPYCVIHNKPTHSTRDCRQLGNMSVQKRWQLVKDKKLCISCFEQHFQRDCTQNDICGIDNCEKSHNKLLHKAIQKPAEKVSVNIHRNCQTSMFQVVPVTLWGSSGKKVDIFALIDSGSDITMLESGIAQRLELKGPYEKLYLKWTNDVVRSETSELVKVSIAGRQPGCAKYQLEDVHVVNSLNLPAQSARGNFDNLSHLQTLPIVRERVQPQMLIGIKHYQLIVPTEVKEGLWDEPVAIRTRLGWTVIGHQQRSNNGFYNVNTHSQTSSSGIELDNLIRQFFEIESSGVHATEPLLSEEDKRSYTILESTINKIEGRYEVGLLWRRDDVKLPDSKPMAEKRLKQFEKRMSQHPSLKLELHRQINEYIEKEYARILDPEEDSTDFERKWYLPIFAVENMNKPGKTRIVWDAAATVDGTSLNSELLKGPDLTCSLLAVLFKFREKPVAITGDIQQMFHQVHVLKSDQHSQLFLWRFDDQEPPKTLVLNVMTFGATCSPCIAQFVKNHHAKQFEASNPRAVEAIIQRHYVDDWLDSFSSEAECLRIVEEVISIHKSAGFNIRNFATNSRDVEAGLQHLATECRKPLIDGNPDSKVLGMWWDANTDSFYFKVNFSRMHEEVKRRTRKPTKREVLSRVMAMFDPVGLIAHRIVLGKMLVHDVWKSGIDWDTQINNEEFVKWSAWLSTVQDLNNIRVPRCYFKEETHEVELHVFVDAGEGAMAAVAYFRSGNGDDIQISLISGKTKVTPIKWMSTPKMELQAAVIGVRLAKTIRDAHTLKITRQIFWCDSNNVISWIRSSTRKFIPFVAHRVGEILDTSHSSEWKWIPSKENAADAATNWKIREQDTDRWLNGPTFLLRDEEDWPKEDFSKRIVLESEDDTYQHLAIAEGQLLIPDPERFSNWRRMVRSMAYALRFSYGTKQSEIITVAEEEQATQHIIRAAQQEAYPAEYAILKTGEDTNEIIREKSRVQDSEFCSYEIQNPIIMPPRNRFTYLLVEFYHRKFQHENHSSVMNAIREKFLIPKLRATLRNVRSGCRRCRVLSAKPAVPEMAPLPACRLSAYTPPFTYTGVDLFGPMEVAIGRRIEKRWGVIFTCLTSRAVHLEPVTSLSSDAFILTLRCFVARHGQPRKLYSDNGTKFIGTNNELRKIWLHQIPAAVRDNFQHIDWEFIPPGAPHMGGAWERLVRSVKRGLMSALPTKKPSDHLLRAVLYEVENIVNSRPLTYIGEDENSIGLTPNHLILGCVGASKPIAPMEDLAITYRKGWQYQQHLVAVFWRRWLSEYLPSISTRTKWWEPVRPLCEGDVVAMADESAVNKWTLGVVETTILSKDGKIRQAMIRTPNGIRRRPVSRLAVLVNSEVGEKQPVFSTRGSVADSGD